MTIKVKPLVWAHVPESFALGTNPYDEAEGFGGSYVVECRADGRFDMWKPNLSNGDRFPDVEAAKAAAQADYEARILSAIEAVDPATIRVEALREELAAAAHTQWAHWFTHMHKNMTAENVERWTRQSATAYADLTEQEKDSDRFWADRILALIDKEKDHG